MLDYIVILYISFLFYNGLGQKKNIAIGLDFEANLKENFN